MNYHEKVMAYADIIQIFSSNGTKLADLLEDKIEQYNSDLDNREFWTEVAGRIYRNSMYRELEELRGLERTYSNNYETFPDVFTLVRSPNLLTWVKALDEFAPEVDFLMEYQQDNMIEERASTQQKFDSCMSGLKFFNDAITRGVELEQLFRYIPLMTWTVETLWITGQMHDSFKPFLVDSFVPVLRAHQRSMLIFIDLIENEEKYLAEEGIKEVTIKKADVFTREYEPEKVDVFIPADPKADGDPEAHDPYLDGMAYSIRQYVEGGIVSHERLSAAKREWALTPLTCIYRNAQHAKMLGVYDEYVTVISPKVLREADKVLYAHLKAYTEDNLLESAIVASENVIMDVANGQQDEVTLNHWNNAIENLFEVLEEMVAKGLVTAKGARDTFHRVRKRGKMYGLQFGNN